MLIKCPECGKEVSDKAAACIHCGYPFGNAVNENKVEPDNVKNIADILLVWNSGNMSWAVTMLRHETGMTVDDAFNYLIELTHSFPSVYERECARLIEEAEQKERITGCPHYESLSERKAKKTLAMSKVCCPTCGSSDVEKVTSTAKVTNIALFGLFGNKRKMQFKCKSCGYMW